MPAIPVARMARSYDNATCATSCSMKALNCVLLSLAVTSGHTSRNTSRAPAWIRRAGAAAPVLDLTCCTTRARRFSFLSDAGGWQRWFFTTVRVGVSAWIALWLNRCRAEKRWLSASLALILSGAVGNLIDRVIQGYVVDFIFVHWATLFPAFNVPLGDHGRRDHD